MNIECLRGSEWRKCDLHIHTPFSKETCYGDRNKTETWDKFIADIDANYEVGSIIGICDYNTFDGYFKIKKEYPNLFEKYTILPVIELRTDDYVGKDNKQKINLHIVFSDDLSYEELNRFLNYPMTIDKKRINDVPDFNSNPVSMLKIFEYLDDNKIYLENKFLLMLGRNEANEVENGIKGMYMSKVHFICSASETISIAEKSKKDTDQYYSSYNIKYLHCSDAHSFSTNSRETTRKIGHCYTWIKGKPIFETLRQAFFSYDSRIKIQETKPLQAVNVLEDMEINIPEEIKIGNNDCCFAGENHKLELNPALNCFIGGRGTGKSFLLQLMCSNNTDLLPVGEKNIVNKMTFPNWTDFVKIDEIEFEYFGQGKIEEFYENKEQFQKSISDRLKKFWETEEYKLDDLQSVPKTLTNMINENKQPLEGTIKTIEDQINLISSKIANDNEIEKLKKDIVSRRKIVNIYTNEDYIELSKKHSLISEKNEFFKSSKSLFTSLVNKIKSVYDGLKKIDPEEKYKDILYYAKEYNSILDKLQDLTNISEDSTIKKLEEDLINEFNISSSRIKEYFIERGMSKSNTDDLVKAQSELISLETKLRELENKNEIEEVNFATVSSSIEDNSRKYCDRMKFVLNRTETYLKEKQSKEISNLTFKYEFDKEKAFSDFAEFIKKQADINESDFKSILNKKENYVDYDLVDADTLKDICSSRAKTLKSSEKILNYFNSNKRNKQLYNLQYLLCKNNWIKYELFNILYQNKSLDSLSFGQRATAIVITLLVFGNKPLLIDEPETHLDQRFIANELVNIIKQVKNEKQIIFATHNANIVINADAEQIYILKNGEDGKTSISQMTIEDVYDQSKKEELLLLEGSLQAFKKREEKYVI